MGDLFIAMAIKGAICAVVVPPFLVWLMKDKVQK